LPVGLAMALALALVMTGPIPCEAMGRSVFARKASEKNKLNGELWNTDEKGVETVLQHSRNETFGRDVCAVFLLYGSTCVFSREMYRDLKQLSREYASRMPFVALDKSQASLHFLMHHGFHAVPQVIFASNAGRVLLQGGDEKSLRENLETARQSHNASCDIAAFKDVLPGVLRIEGEIIWTDRHKEVARWAWFVLLALAAMWAGGRAAKATARWKRRRALRRASTGRDDDDGDAAEGKEHDD